MVTTVSCARCGGCRGENPVSVLWTLRACWLSLHNSVFWEALSPSGASLPRALPGLGRLRGHSPARHPCPMERCRNPSLYTHLARARYFISPGVWHMARVCVRTCVKLKINFIVACKYPDFFPRCLPSVFWCRLTEVLNPSGAALEVSYSIHCTRVEVEVLLSDSGGRARARLRLWALHQDPSDPAAAGAWVTLCDTLHPACLEVETAPCTVAGRHPHEGPRWAFSDHDS